MADDDAWFKHFMGTVAAETAHLSLAASGAYLHFRNSAWNIPTRGVLCLPLDGFARIFHASPEQTTRVIDELTCDSRPVLVRETLPDGRIKLSYPTFVKMADLREKRTAAAKKRHDPNVSILHVQNASKLCVLCSKRVGRGNAKGEGASPPVDDDLAVPPPSRADAEAFVRELGIDCATDRKAVANVQSLLGLCCEKCARFALKTAIEKRTTWPTKYALGIVQGKQQDQLRAPKHAATSEEWKAKPYTPG